MDKNTKQVGNPRNTIAVVGSRGYNNYVEFCAKIEHLIQNLENITFVSGGCKSGGDALIAKYCKENNVGLEEFIPDWDKHGKAAGYIRNAEIVNASDGLIAFWDEKSRGTKHSIDLARKKGITVKIVKI